jgi:hypothetical protein
MPRAVQVSGLIQFQILITFAHQGIRLRKQSTVHSLPYPTPLQPNQVTSSLRIKNTLLRPNMSSPLTGIWNLLSFHLAHPDNPSETLLQPLGDSPLGRIAFGADGFMSCLLMPQANAQPLDMALWAQASDEDVLRVARSFTAYCGRYRVSEEEKGQAGSLSTRVEVALDPNWIGGEQVRRWSVRKEGGRELLTLRPVQEFVLPVSTIS